MRLKPILEIRNLNMHIGVIIQPVYFNSKDLTIISDKTH